VLGWESRIGVREGIARTVEWMREQAESLDRPPTVGR
jgi:nucleoside-diphosphate-sugar epimerase